MISEQLVKQVTGQEDNNRVYKLDLSVRGIVAISNLKAFQKLRCIVLDFNRISVIENLSSLIDLRQLHLQGNQIRKIAGLDNNKALVFLNLSKNNIQKIENISHLMKLESLYLDNNKISKLVGLQYLKQLRILSVKNNQLSSIDSMPAFSKLQNLDLSENSISKISASLLASNTKLISLNLAKNNISDISFLAPLIKLQTLDISHNQIENLTIKAPLKNLEYLNISHNSISQLPSFFALFPQLTTINLSNNYIGSQVELLQALASSELITDVDFTENPMHSQDFQQTLFNLYQFDRINGRTKQKAGAKYYGQIQSIKKQFRDNPDIYEQDDQEDHKIKMSGFYSQDLQLEFTGIKPNRPLSPTARRVKNTTESESINQIDKIYKEFIENNTKIDTLRQQYLMILQRNNVQIPKVQIIDNTEQRLTTEQQSVDMRITEIKEQRIEKDGFKKFKSIERELKLESDGNKTKWQQIKKKQKLFNIREFSRKKSAREPSNSKVTKKNELFKTQVNTKWNAEAPLLKTLTRAASVKKENSRIL